MIAFIITALFVGFVIVYVVPIVNGYAAKIPGASTVVTNKFANLLLVGLVVLLGLHLFMALAKKV